MDASVAPMPEAYSSSAQDLAILESDRASREMAEKRARARKFKQQLHERLARQIALRSAREKPAEPAEGTTSAVARCRKVEMQRDMRRASALAAKERQAKTERRRAERMRTAPRSADVERLHDLARQQRERQLDEQLRMQAELLRRGHFDRVQQRERIAAKRFNAAFRATLTDKMASMDVDLPPLCPCGGVHGQPTTSHGKPMCWGVNGWSAPSANCP
jgi:hypothetical protein